MLKTHFVLSAPPLTDNIPTETLSRIEL